MELAKLPEAMRDQFRSRQRSDPQGEVEIQDDNINAFELFCAISGQWRVSGMGAVIGLDYSAIQSAMWMRGIRKRAESMDLFWRIQVIEAAVLKVFRDKDAAAARRRETNPRLH